LNVMIDHLEESVGKNGEAEGFGGGGGKELVLTC